MDRGEGEGVGTQVILMSDHVTRCWELISTMECQSDSKVSLRIGTNHTYPTRSRN